MTGLVERLLKRAQEDQTCADNSAVVADALSEQMRLFEAREGHNIYAVRMAVDHQSSVKRDCQYAADLREAATEITGLQAENASLREQVEKAREDALEEAAKAIYCDCDNGDCDFKEAAETIRELARRAAGRTE